MTAYDARWDALKSAALKAAQGTVRGRYAPSPTGRLHLGNLRTALLAWLQVRLNKGVLVLRMEDLDRPRVKPGSADQILDDLLWLGLDWDEGPRVGGPFGPYDQSLRDDLYQMSLSHLQTQALVFPCFCSRKDIAQAASAPHGKSLIYPGTCRVTDPVMAEPPPRDGRRAAWRFRVTEEEVICEDRLMGSYAQQLGNDVGDFVVRRTDGLFAYQLAVVVDDALMGITDVLRGVDLLDSSPRQMALYRALRLPIPQFWHVPLLKDTEGARMSKRDGSDSLDTLRDKGWDAAQIIGHLAASLKLVPAESRLSAQELCQELDLETFSSVLSQHI